MKLRGFTIVEVVVAVAIVTLLAAIVIPDLWAAQQRITGEMFMNNVHDITTTLELYKKEHSGLYPTQLEELASYYDKQPINQYTKVACYPPTHINLEYSTHRQLTVNHTH